MTSSFKFLLAITQLWLIFSAGVVLSQEPDHGPLGFIRMLNAVSVGTGKLEVLIDGVAARPEGYELGNVTGGIALKPKAYSVEIRREGVKKGITKVDVRNNETLTLIPFGELMPAENGKPAQWEIRILRLKQFDPESKRTATFVSVSHESELKLELRQSTGKWETVIVKRLELIRTDIKQSHGYLPLRYQDRDMKALSIAPSGNFVAVLYDDENGVVQAKTFIDYKYLSAD